MIVIGSVYDSILGHLILSPSSHRMYNSSAMGDRLTGEASAALSAPGVVGVVTAPDGPAMSSTTSVTTSPRFVISLFRVTRRWGKSLLDVCTCCRTAALLTCSLAKSDGVKTPKEAAAYSFSPARMSRITLKESSGLTSLSSWKPRDNILSDSISRASMSSVMACRIDADQLTNPPMAPSGGITDNTPSVSSGEQRRPRVTAP